MALTINSTNVPYRNVEGADRTKINDFKTLKKGTRTVITSNYIISKEHLRTIVEDPENAEFDAFRIFPLLKSDNTLEFYLMPVITGGGVGPGPGQGVKVPA
jgi:hypothetical protein